MPNQHAQNRRQEILRAATALFAEQGYQRTSVKEVAERAGIAPGTIYLYFDSKGDLLIGLMMRLAELEDLGDEVERALQNDPRAFLTTMFRNRMGRVVESEEMLRAILPQMLVQPALRQHFHRQFVAPVIELMERYVDAKIERGDIQLIDAPLTVRAVQSMFIGLLLLRILDEDVLRERWDEMPEVMAALLFEGLSPRPDERADTDWAPSGPPSSASKSMEAESGNPSQGHGEGEV
jgi:AcrR family transcriptional regulator